MVTARSKTEELLKIYLQRMLDTENLDSQRLLTKTLVSELNVDFLDFSAALLCLCQQQTLPPLTSLPIPQAKPKPSNARHSEIKMIRYRIEVGHKHQATLEQITKILVEESGVDKNNVSNVDIQSEFTFIELPDEMPQDIFIHLKSVEINQQKMNIKRVKNRSRKKKSNSHFRRNRQKQAISTNV